MLNNLLRGVIKTKASILLFFLFPIFLYSFFSTNFSLNFFEPHFLWKGYNYYFLAVINGQLDIPSHAIGREASYIGDKVYMYYGALPLLMRGLLYPFVNLEQTSIAAFSVFTFSIVGQSFLQYSLLLKFKQSITNQTSTAVLVGFIVLSILLWFGSATFIILQNSTLYHEPYAASLCLTNIFLGLLVKDHFFLGNNRKVNLVPYAIVSALCLHARMPTALALYCVMVFLLLVQIFKYSKNSATPRFQLSAFIIHGFKSYYLTLFILFIGGVSILLLNYAKFNDPLAFMGPNYGYFFLEGYTERRCNLVPQSDYASILRIIPNLVIYLTGSLDFHWSLSWHLNTGFGRKEMPVIPFGILWMLPLLSFVFLLLLGVKRFSSITFKYVLMLLALLSIGTLFQLSYPTIAHRYSAELWLPLAFSMIFLWSYFLHKQPTMQVKYYRLMIYSALCAAFIGVSYQFYLSFTSKYYLEDGPIYKHEQHHYPQSDIDFLSNLTAEKIKAFKIEYHSNKQQACEKLAKKEGIPVKK